MGRSLSFWWRWLFWVGVGLVGFGLSLALFNQSGLFDVVLNDRIDPAFWESGTPDVAGRGFQSFVYGVLGATVAGWGVFLALVARFPFRSGEPWAWICVAAGVGLWFVVDTTLSVIHGAYWNAYAVNAPLAFLAALPLAATRREFFSRPGA